MTKDYDFEKLSLLIMETIGCFIIIQVILSTSWELIHCRPSTWCIASLLLLFKGYYYFLLKMGTIITLIHCPLWDANNKEYVTYRLYHKGNQEEDSHPFEGGVFTLSKESTSIASLKSMGKQGEGIWTDKYGCILLGFERYYSP